MRAAVLGLPIAHSLSPLLHRAAYDALGLPDWSYEAVELAPAGLAGFLARLGPEWAGLSLTMPLKQAVLPLLSSRSRLVEVTGAANTVVLREGRRHGENTDVSGIVAALRAAGVTACSRAAVLGAGATAASALAALHELGADQVRVLGRSAERVQRLRPVAEALGIELLVGRLHPLEVEDRWPSVLINTTPAGALDDFAAASDPGPDAPALLDVVYAPWPTPLAAVYTAAGGVVVGGAVMLLHQAAAQVELLTGRAAPLEAMRAALA